eukprot:6183275-Pleurochrysis_carterae.AAC.1
MELTMVVGSGGERETMEHGSNASLISSSPDRCLSTAPPSDFDLITTAAYQLYASVPSTAVQRSLTASAHSARTNRYVTTTRMPEPGAPT